MKKEREKKDGSVVSSSPPNHGYIIVIIAIYLQNHPQIPNDDFGTREIGDLGSEVSCYFILLYTDALYREYSNMYTV